MSNKISVQLFPFQIAFLEALDNYVLGVSQTQLPSTPVGSPVDSATTPDTTTPEKKSAPAPKEELADGARPFKRPEVKRRSAVMLQLDKLLKENATGALLIEGKKAVDVAERKKSLKDLKRLEKLKTDQPDDAAAIDAEIGHVNQEIKVLDVRLAGYETSLLEGTAPTDVPDLTPPAPTDAPDLTPPAPKTKTVKTMTAAAGGATYEAFAGKGWSDDQMVSGGFLIIEEVPVETTTPDAPGVPGVPGVPGAPGAEVSIELVREKTAAAFGTMAAKPGGMDEVTKLIAGYGETIEHIKPEHRQNFIDDLDTVVIDF